MKVSVIVPAKNEAENLPRCLGSVVGGRGLRGRFGQHGWDGGNRRGPWRRVAQFEYQGGFRKRKIGRWRIFRLRNEWVFFLDADETLPPEAEAEIREIVERPGGTTGTGSTAGSSSSGNG